MRGACLRVFSFLGVLALGASAQAEAPGDFAAAMGLTAADGTVRTQAGVRLSLSPASGAGDYVVAMRAPVQAQLPDMRRCFAEGMVRDAAVEGRVVVELEALAKGKAKAAVTLNETGQPELGTCMSDALARAPLTGIKPGARSLVAIDLSNPAAATVRAAQEHEAQQVAIAIGPDGTAESHGATQQGEIKFHIRGSAYASQTIKALHHDVASRMAGLLDCRRKASRRYRAAEGTVHLGVKVAGGRVMRVNTGHNGVNDRSAPACVSAWLERSENPALRSADLEVDVTFAR